MIAPDAATVRGVRLMTPAEWDTHRGQWCERCKHNSKRKPCPVAHYMDLDPNDVLCTRLMRGERCSQYEPKENRKERSKRAA